MKTNANATQSLCLNSRSLWCRRLVKARSFPISGFISESAPLIRSCASEIEDYRVLSPVDVVNLWFPGIFVRRKREIYDSSVNQIINLHHLPSWEFHRHRKRDASFRRCVANLRTHHGSLLCFTWHTRDGRRRNPIYSFINGIFHRLMALALNV